MENIKIIRIKENDWKYIHQLRLKNNDKNISEIVEIIVKFYKENCKK